MKRAIGGILLSSLLALALAVHSTELRVAAAADLKFALDELVREFHAIHPTIDVSVSYGSLGNNADRQ